MSEPARQQARQVFAEVFAGGPVARRKLSHEGTLVLDSEGLSKLIADDETAVALVAEARSRGMEVVSVRSPSSRQSTPARTGPGSAGCCPACE